MPDQPHKSLTRSLENKAVHYLARYPSSTANLRGVLLRFARRKLGKKQRSTQKHSGDDYAGLWTDKAQVAAAIDGVLTRFTELGYISDEDYARARVRLLRGRGYSRQRIMGYLYAKGVDRNLIEAALAHDFSARVTHITGDDECDSDPDAIELAAARRYAQRRRLGCYASHASRQKPDWQTKHLASMLRAGFAYAIAKQALQPATDDMA